MKREFNSFFDALKTKLYIFFTATWGAFLGLILIAIFSFVVVAFTIIAIVVLSLFHKAPDIYVIPLYIEFGLIIAFAVYMVISCYVITYHENMYDDDIEQYKPYIIWTKVYGVFHFMFEKIVNMIFGVSSYSYRGSVTYGKKKKTFKQRQEEYRKNPYRPYYEGDITHPRHYQIQEQKKMDKALLKGTSMEKMLKYKQY